MKNGYIPKNSGIGDISMSTYSINAPGLGPHYINRAIYLMNLDVNFVNNYRMKVCDYKVAAVCFEDVISNFKNHAFAHYYLAKAQEAVNEDPILIKLNKDKFNEIIKKDNVWKEYAENFSLEIYEKM